MFGLSATAVGYLGAGALLLVLGYLIRFREWTFLIAGYDATAEVPSSVAASITGNTVLRIGIAAVVVGLAFAVTDPPALTSTIYTVVVLAVVRLLYRLNTYTPENEV
jgi:hypothetical protein